MFLTYFTTRMCMMLTNFVSTYDHSLYQVSLQDPPTIFLSVVGTRRLRSLVCFPESVCVN